MEALCLALLLLHKAKLNNAYFSAAVTPVKKKQAAYKQKKILKKDFVTATNICDTDNRALLLYRLQTYLLK